MHKTSPLCILLAIAAAPLCASGQTVDGQASTMQEVTVTGTPPNGRKLPALAVDDAAQLLSGSAGYAVASGGGVSGLPNANGFSDDRLNVRIDGMELAPTCANHMNGPLSYVAPTQVSSISLWAGVSPVSLGGDSIGGSIVVQTAKPVYADAGAAMLDSATLSFGGRSVDHGISAGLNATVAGSNFSAVYEGVHAQAQSYKAGGGEEVLDSLYKNNNQLLLLALRGDDRQFTLRVGYQTIPYQGFPNQNMDMVGSQSRYANLGYEGKLEGGKINASLYWQDSNHGMGYFSNERPGDMPMLAQGKNEGYAVSAAFTPGPNDSLLVGNEYHALHMNETWPAVPDPSMMLGPLDYIDINNGMRNRAALFGQWDHRSDAQWTTQFGLRDENVRMNTGNVQPYSTDMMDNPDAMAAVDFNQRSHARHDNNVDLTALARYEASATGSYEFGLARKTRSPNLFERYAWGQSAMAMSMTGWFGDGNGYVGNPDLKPEIAYNLSMSADWHSANRAWQVRLSPFYSRVYDYIDADLIGSSNPGMGMNAQGNLLQFANHDATIYGFNALWTLALFDDADHGRLAFKGTAGATRGGREDGGNLYRMLPFNATFALEHTLGRWNNSAETVVMAKKTRVDTDRLEPQTAGYALLNLRSAYWVGKASLLSLGVSNVFDKRYDLPLGGVDLAALASDSMGALRPLPGYGRSIDAGLSIGF